MKIKKLLFVLAMAGIPGLAFAQREISSANSRLPFSPLSKTESLFNDPRPGNSMAKFYFILPQGNRMILEFNNISQVDSLPDVDSLLRKVWADLQNFSDSLNDPLASRRVDYYMETADIKIRILNYPQHGDVYQLRDKEITQLKLEQDTLRIRLFTQGMRRIAGEQRIVNFHYFISFMLNNINELPALINSGRAEAAIKLLKKDLAGTLNQKRTKDRRSQYYAIYDMVQQKRMSPPPGSSIINHSVKSISLPPYVQTGIQYIRGSWAVSAGVGLDLLVRHISVSQEQHYRLIWEPYFFFSRNTSGKLVTENNSFITFKYNYSVHAAKAAKQVQFAENFSLGYLIQRKGDWFEPTTFKFSVPGLQTKNILVEPEFIFNKFFRNFSPSVKLVLYLE